MHRVVVIGSGFGGLFAAKTLRKADVSVTLIDRNSYHLFQPLLYQVATGILSEGEVAPPTREILRRQRNLRVLIGEATSIDEEDNTAYGGEKQSGLGRFGGTWSIDEFTTHHWVSVQHTPRPYPLPASQQGTDSL